jgi:hypothetical protein
MRNPGEVINWDSSTIYTKLRRNLYLINGEIYYLTGTSKGRAFGRKLSTYEDYSEELKFFNKKDTSVYIGRLEIALSHL